MMEDLTTYLKQRATVQKLLEMQTEIHGPDGNIESMMESVKTNLPSAYLKHSKRLYSEVTSREINIDRFFRNDEFAYIMHGLNICLFRRGPVTEIDIHVYYDNALSKFEGRLTTIHVTALKELKRYILTELPDIYFKDNLFISRIGSSVFYLSPEYINNPLIDECFYIDDRTRNREEITVTAVDVFQRAMGMEG